MQAALKGWFGSDRPLEVINFNISMVFMAAGFIASFLSGIAAGESRPFYYLLGIGMIIITFFIAYVMQSGGHDIAAFSIVLMLETVVFPVTYFIDGRFMSFMILYYFSAFLFNVFVQEGAFRIISYVVFWISWITSVLIGCVRSVSHGQSLDAGLNIYIDIIIPFLLCGIQAVTCTLASLRYYRMESAKAELTRREAGEIEKSKDIFLMNMSHEIRTPMNAIMSASEIMLSKDISHDTRLNVHHIMNACKALISTLDDLLIFSRNNEKDIVLADTEYDLRTFLDDIINMIAIRLMGTDVKLYVYIDPFMPRRLYGDVVRVRQVFINILNNAVKYTKRGHIMLRVVISDVKDDSIIMHVEVEDTGIGIKEEMIPMLFNDFQRIEDNMNESLKAEGSGLGLSITRNIVKACGGDINVTSEYNKGSVFSFDIPQRVSDTEPLAETGRYRDLGIIVCDQDTEMTEVLTGTLKAMRIRCTEAVDSDKLSEVIEGGGYTHLFISPECLAASCDLPVLMSADIDVVVMREVGDTSDDGGDAKLAKPVSVLNISEYLDNNAAVSGEEEIVSIEEEDEREIIVSDARALVVEDNVTNLMVAERLLGSIGFEVSTANSGSSALGLINVMKYDMIFIDYMMAGMNGVDTLRAVRRLPEEWTSRVPCIVLTADAHGGAKQMLINAGFDDYLAKPIDMNELEYMVRRYMPGEKLLENA